MNDVARALERLLNTNLRPSRSEFIDIRGLRYHLRCWGPAPERARHTLIMLHGWIRADQEAETEDWGSRPR